MRERIANSTHLMIEFFHAERWHPILISGSRHRNADPATLTLIRRILGREPKETKQRERRGVPKRKPSQASTPTVTGPCYRPRFRDEPNAMTRSLRERTSPATLGANHHTPA